MLKKAHQQTLARRAPGLFQTSPGNDTRRAIKARRFIFVVVAAALTFASVVSAQHFSEWGVPVNAESIPGTSSHFNTPFNDDCPIQAPDGQA